MDKIADLTSGNYHKSSTITKIQYIVENVGSQTLGGLSEQLCVDRTNEPDLEIVFVRRPLARSSEARSRFGQILKSRPFNFNFLSVSS